MRTGLFVSVMISVCAFAGAAALASPASLAPMPSISPLPAGVPSYTGTYGGVDASTLSHDDFSHLTRPSDADQFRKLLIGIREEGLQLRAKNGGVLTEADRARLQGEIDALFKRFNAHVQRPAPTGE